MAQSTTTTNPNLPTIPAPSFDEVAAVAYGRDITQYWVGPLLMSHDQLLARKGHYDLQFYEEVLSDEQVFACYQQRFKALSSCEWEVKAGGDRRIDQKAADFLQEQLAGIPWDDVNEKHLYANHYGYSVAECMWMRDGTGLITFDDTKQGIRVRNRRRFKFAQDFSPRLLTWADQFKGEELPERKFWHFSVGADNHDDPYGRGLGHWLYWLTYFKRNDMKVWLRYLEKFSQPTVLVEYPQGMPKSEQDNLLKAAYSIANAAAAKLPQGSNMSLLEAARSGTADYQALWDACNAGISKVILSQTMTTDSGSSRSQAEVHEGVQRKVIKGDADLICGSFNESVVRWLIDWNFPGAAYPKVWRCTEQEEDLKAKADKDKILFDMGFVPSNEYIVQTYGEGFAQPDTGGEVKGPGLNGAQLQSILGIITTMQQGGLTPAAAMALITLAVPSIDPVVAAAIVQPPEPAQQEAGEPVPDEEGAADQATDAGQEPAQPTPPPAPTFAEPATDKEEVIDRWSGELREQAGPLIDGWIDQIQGLLGEAGGLQEFSERLLILYPDLEGAQLKQIMNDAMLASSLAGRAGSGTD